MRDTVMSTVAVGIVVEVAREAIHRGIDWKTAGIVVLPILGISGRQHARALGERVLAKRDVLVGWRLHDVSIEDVGVQDSCSVVVFEVCRVFRVGLLLLIRKLLLLMLMMMLELALDGRVRWTCLLIREPVGCSSKGHAGAE